MSRREIASLTAVRVEGALRLGHEKFAARQAQLVPAGRPGQRERRKGVADKAQKNKGAEHAREIDAGRGPEVVSGRRAARRAGRPWCWPRNAGRRASRSAGDRCAGNAQAGASSARHHSRSPRRARNRWILTRTGHPAAAQLEVAFAQIPVEQPPPETGRNRRAIQSPGQGSRLAPSTPSLSNDGPAALGAGKTARQAGIAGLFGT